jgi:hypothetical protein
VPFVYFVVPPPAPPPFATLRLCEKPPPAKPPCLCASVRSPSRAIPVHPTSRASITITSTASLSTSTTDPLAVPFVHFVIPPDARHSPLRLCAFARNTRRAPFPKKPSPPSQLRVKPPRAIPSELSFP